MLKFLNILLIFSCLSFASNAQDKKSYKKLFLEGEYFFLRGDFDEARFIYSELIKMTPVNGNLDFLIGSCYLSIYGEKQKSIPYLEQAVQSISAGYNEGSYKEMNAPKESLFALARAYHISNDFKKAKEYYNKYKTVMKLKDVAEIEYVYKQIESCELAELMIKKPISPKRIEMPEEINSFSSCYDPVFSPKDSILIYMAKKPFYSAIMMSRCINGKWQVPIVINDQVGADDNCQVTSISPNGNEIYISKKEDDGNFDLYSSTLRKGIWSKMLKLGDEINTIYDETHATLNPDGKSLYFTSNRPGGEGAMDIYVATRNNDGEWANPVSLGQPINSIYSEETPFFSTDGKILFFSSMGHSSMGGYDIFYSSMLPTKTWSYPANIGYPISTSDDDLFFFPLGNGKKALYSGFMDTGEGPQRICFINMDTTKAERPVALKGEIKLGDNMMDFDKSFKVTVINTEGMDTITSLSPDSKTGEFSAVLKPGNYQISMNGDGYTEKKVNISIVGGLSQNDIQMKTGMAPMSVTSGEFLVIKNLLFDFNSDKLDTAAFHELEKLYQIMKLHPEIYVQITGHADAMGSREYNLDLSIRRARKVVEFLQNKGISKERFISRGVGESENIALNTNPDGSDNPIGRKLNRHTEIKLINNSDNKIMVEELYVPENLRPKAGTRYSVLLRESAARATDIPATITGENIKTIEADKGYLYIGGDFDSKQAALTLLNDALDKGFPDAKILSKSEINELVVSLTSGKESGKGPFTIQLVALKKAIDVSWFKSFKKVDQYVSDDGYNRYTSGIYSTRELAQIALPGIISQGFPDAYIMELSRYKGNTGITDTTAVAEQYYFTIQFSATKKPADKDKFRKIENVRINIGEDGYYHYTTGIFPNRFIAEKELENIKSMGFTDAFIRKIEKQQ